jgi:hypothetical protein
MWGQTKRSPFSLTLGGENRKTIRLSPGLPEKREKISQGGSVHPRSLGAPARFALERL